MPKAPPFSKSKLTHEMRAFLVQRLAVFDTPTQAAKALKDEFGVEIRRSSVEAYDPTKKASKKYIAKQWEALFWATRERFLSKLEDIPAANRAVRIRKLARAADVFESKGNLLAMADMLERIAKEVGNVHTNRRELTGKDGGPIEVHDLTDDQMDRRLAQLLGYTLPGVSEDPSAPAATPPAEKLSANGPAKPGPTTH